MLNEFDILKTLVIRVSHIIGSPKRAENVLNLRRITIFLHRHITMHGQVIIRRAAISQVLSLSISMLNHFLDNVSPKNPTRPQNHAQVRILSLRDLKP